MPEGALTPFTACDAYRYFARRALLITSQSRSRIEYLLPTDCIVVLDSYFNFTKKTTLVDNFLYDFLKNWWWLTFLGYTVCLQVAGTSQYNTI